jgi:serine/arginine repetitive matrix protein 2
MAISSDKQIHSDLDERRASPVPSRILPGYIPGMPRPMTPRDFDPDDQRSHSTTPRATSPIAANFVDTSASSIPINITSGLLRRGSTSSQSRPSPHAYSPPASPLFLQRSVNGKYTPDDSNRDNYTTEFDNPLKSSLLSRRRPASPLSSAPYQSMAVSSRPGTPSNITWTTNANDHTRNDSWASDGGVSSSDIHGGLEGHNPGPRSLRSPALPDSPTLDGDNPSMNQISPLFHEQNTFVLDNRPSSKMSITELGSPTQVPRSVTPTQTTSRSPISPTFSDFGNSSSRNSNKRSSKQNAASSLFNLGPIPPLVFSPLANSSRSSLESAGSSYHSWEDEKDRYLNLFSDTDVQQPAWHDIANSEPSSSATPGGSPDDDWDAEEVISRYAGLKKSDFIAIQEKLVTVAVANTSQERAPSAMRRRRPSTSQSNYSVNGRENRVCFLLIQ